jgi:hypothetical protein
MWSFANKDMIPYAIPIIFTAKGLVVDSSRIYRDIKKKDFSTPLKYGKNDNCMEKFAYAVIKGTYISGVPIVGSTFNSLMGVATTTFGLYRGIRSLIVNPSK